MHVATYVLAAAFVWAIRRVRGVWLVALGGAAWMIHVTARRADAVATPAQVPTESAVPVVQLDPAANA